ncbi:MAG: methyltransferase [Minisyncoccia bacterium]|jgi:16S rRNA (guanine1207-N2)-methyltransferase
MKDYSKKLKEYDKEKITLIKHQWGQNATSLYNQVVQAWDHIPFGKKIAIISYKKFGMKSALTFFKKNGLVCEVVGKGPDGLRLVECEKKEHNHLKPIEISNIVKFDFLGKSYKADVGSSIFSKTGLDKGTRFLLESFFSWDIDLNGKEVVDMGTGWGAISIIIANEFPKARITAYEKDDASFEAAKENLSGFSQVNVKQVDLAQNIKRQRGTFDYILSNPPFHVTTEERHRIFKYADSLLKKKGEMIFVVENSFTNRFALTAKSFFDILQEEKNADYSVLRCRKFD